MAKYFVNYDSETCQQSCDIARLWALLFWGSQTVMSLGYYYVHRTGNGKIPFVLIGCVQKLVVGTIIVIHYFKGILMLPICLAGVTDWVLLVFMFSDLRASPEWAGAWTKILPDLTPAYHYLLKNAEAWWYPWVVGLGSGVNNFTMVLTGPLVVLFLSGVLAAPQRRIVTAFANAFGATVGVAALIYVFNLYGKDEFEEMYSQVLSGWMPTLKDWGERFGILGVVIYCCLPLILHPVVLVGLTIMNMNQLVLLLCILVGRTIKYIIMGQLALSGSDMLKLFGPAAKKFLEGKK